MGLLLVQGLPAAEFSRQLTPEEFAAAGLTKLSAVELARLDTLVERARAAVPATGAPDDLAAAPADRPRSWRERMRVVLAPGTEIAYRTLETQLRGRFNGYEPGQILTLANGQRWRVVEGRYWAPAKTADRPRPVRVEPGVLGSFFLAIEDGGRPKVVYVDTVE